MRKPIFILWALLCLAIATTIPAAEGDAKLPEAANVEGAENDNQPEDTAADKEAHSEDRRKSAWFYLAYLPCLIPILIIAGIIYAIKTKPNPADEARPTPTKKFIVVTAPNIPGKKIVRVLGLVRGNTIRARHVGKEIVAGLRNVVGGEVTEYAKLLSESREQALDRMLVEAESLGANAVISVQFETSVIMGGAAEMMAYGTAVILEED